MVDLDAPPAANIAAVAKAKGITPADVTVVILDRPRHEGLIKAVRAAGARIHLITDGDVAGAIMAARPDTGIDLMLGIGGTPEGIVAACALKCLGGVILGKLAPRDDAERRKALDAGHDLDRVLTTDDLVSSEDCFFAATGITDGELMAGVRYKPRRRDHPLARHALQVRHDPLDPQRARPVEAQRLQHDQLRLTPSGDVLPRRWSSRASARTARSNSGRWSPSFGPCARVSGSSTPVTRMLAPGNASWNSAINGVEPPVPMSTGAAPSQASARAECAAGSAARPLGSDGRLARVDDPWS